MVANQAKIQVTTEYEKKKMHNLRQEIKIDNKLYKYRGRLLKMIEEFETI